MQKQQFFIIGGTGFIGSVLSEHLANKGHHVHTLSPNASISSHPNIHSHRGSQDHQPLVRRILEECETVIHLASKTTPGDSIGTPYTEAIHNIAPALRFLEILQEYNRRMVFVSSGGTVYGNPKEVPIRETHSFAPISYHGAGKAALEAFMNAFANQYDGRLVILRPSNVYGPGQGLRQGFGVIRTMLGCALNHSKMSIWGDGETVRDFLFIQDMITLFDAIIEKQIDNGIYNIGSGKGYTLNQLLSVVENVCHQSLDVEYIETRKSDIYKIILDCSKADKELGWRAVVDIEEGIEKTWNWLLHR